MYQPYPQGGEMPPEPKGPARPGRPAPPRTVKTAVVLMYAGAAVTAVTLVVTVLTIHSIESTMETKANYTPQQAHQLVIAAIVEALITLGLWLLMAWANRSGQPWGRIVATVLFVANTIGLLLAFLRGADVVNLLFAVVVWLIGLGAIVLLWRKESSQYFATATPRR
jgi:hypothetical protein